jgi:hypothetical protein
VFRLETGPYPAEFIADTLTSTRALNDSENGTAVSKDIGIMQYFYAKIVT